MLRVALSHLFSASEFFSFSSSSGAKSPAASAIMSLRICSRAAAFFFMSSWLMQRREQDVERKSGVNVSQLACSMQ